ncbi:polyprenyl synthetase family protein [Streptomyces sp. NPDC058548]|uniref:polyprenyl synthetase family protein n=1 Tax=unclassified Streptomyces TaxID=2593676 RepID=UPI00365E2C66
MTVDSPVTASLDLAAVGSAVDRALEGFLARKKREAHALRMPGEVHQALSDFLFAGGKRVRPLLCAAGWYAAGGDPSVPVPVLTAAASLEMFHTFALIHDDVMDRSDTRRGRATVHRTLSALYGAGRSQEAADRIGAAAAILIGDLAMVWSDELLTGAGLTPRQLAAALPIVRTMRTEVMYGQYLDVVAGTSPRGDLDRALRVIRYKTAKYTVEAPLHLGAALAGAGAAVCGALTAYALPLGEAFQLRDDLLGVFGSPTATGKSRLDDLRDGKRTLLLELAHQRADAEQRRTLLTLVGDPLLDEDGAARVRGVLDRTGARVAVEELIRDRREQALHAMDDAPFRADAVALLQRFARTATIRSA